MPAENKKIYKHAVSFGGLAVELVSDDLMLLEINFAEGKKIKNSAVIPGPIRKAMTWLDDYFHGKNSKIEIVLITKAAESKPADSSDKLYFDMTGYTEKEIQIYSELLKVKEGKTVSYSELALKGGVPRGARFAGNCMAGNRFPIIIPCHRVLKADGSIGNYSGGIGIKELLLKHEKEEFR